MNAEIAYAAIAILHGFCHRPRKGPPPMDSVYSAATSLGFAFIDSSNSHRDGSIHMGRFCNNQARCGPAIWLGSDWRGRRWRLAVEDGMEPARREAIVEKFRRLTRGMVVGVPPLKEAGDEAS